MKTFRLPLIVNILALGLAFLVWGLSGLITVVILTIIELSFSFDNAVVNAKILESMSQVWQRIFLTVGILIAVFGMRLLFPLVVVALAAHLTPIAALYLALQQPHEYAKHLSDAHPAIAAFGGVFLGMLFLDWIFEERETRWLRYPEQVLFKVGKIENLAIILMGAVIVLASYLFGHTQFVWKSGLLGMVIYMIVNSLDSIINTDASTIARAGVGSFIYLEIIDASFSFDGVIGAFAITSNIFLIAIGLGIGAMYVRGLTVCLVRKKTLSEYIYLEHGAHWAIGILAILLLTTIKYVIPDMIIGLIGVVFIGAAFVSSLLARRGI